MLIISLKLPNVSQKYVKYAKSLGSHLIKVGRGGGARRVTTRLQSREWFEATGRCVIIFDTF